MFYSRVPFSLLCLCHIIVYQNQGVATINFDTNKYLKIFISKKRISEDIRIKKMIRTNIRIYLYKKNNTNEYPNIFAYLIFVTDVTDGVCGEKLFMWRNSPHDMLSSGKFLHMINVGKLCHMGKFLHITNVGKICQVENFST